MFCRHRNVLLRAAVSICQPNAQASRCASTASKTVKPKATRKPRSATKLSESSTASKTAFKTAGEETKTRKRAPRATKATPKAKTTRTKTVHDASLVEGDLAARLQAVMPWRTRDAKTRGSRTPSSILDPGRVNVVGEKLCDDVLSYMGESLDRHIGCDLIDLNPGSGLWSRKLHERLQPRKHILMEGDAELYAPLLSELTAKDNVELIPKSGIIWKDLNEVLETKLDRQVVQQSGGPPERNDTLLVTANLAANPSRKLFGFESVSVMVLHQFITSIHFSSLFQRYGRVRMLIWTNDDDKRRMVPQSLTRRKRFAFQTELSCEWAHQIVAMDNAHLDTRYLRDEWLNVESAYKTLERMQAQGLVMPPGREPQLHLDALANPDLIGRRLAGSEPPLMKRPFKEELEELRAGVEDVSALSPENVLQGKRREQFLRSREKADAQYNKLFQDLLTERDRLFENAKTMPPDEFEAASKAWLDTTSGLKKNPYNEWATIRDNYHLFRQEEPVLLWDRRAFEPLVPQPSEFFPNSPCALIDLQPKPMNPLFLQYGPNSTRSGDTSDGLLRSWFSQTSHTVPHAMQALWPGFGDSYEACPSLRDPAKGGSPIKDQGALTARIINEVQWTELVQAWMDWPFRPEYHLFLGRTLDDPEGDDDEDAGVGSPDL